MSETKNESLSNPKETNSEEPTQSGLGKPESPNSSTQPKGTKPSGGSSGGVIAIVFSLVAIGIAGYSGYMTYQMQQNPSGQDTDQSLVALQGSMAELQQQVGAIQAAATTNNSDDLTQLKASQSKAISALEQKLDQSLADVRAQVGTSSEDWLLAEVEYLIRLANQRVAMEQDAAGAVALFDSADAILRDAEGIAAFELRQRLAEDIASLRAVGRLDVDGLFVRIGALIRQVDSLEPRRLKYIAAQAVEVEVAETTGFSAKLWAMMGAIGQRLTSLVDYRREGEVIKPILPPEEEYYLRQNLVLKLQLAQLGLLRSDQPVYETSLVEAETWALEYFDPTHQASISFTESLAELSVVEVSRSLPDVSGSLHAVRKLLSRFHEEAVRGSEQ